MSGKRRAVCVGIREYADPLLVNRKLRFATKDAQDIAVVLQDPTRGAFDSVILKTSPEDTTKAAIEIALNELLNGPDCQPDDLALIFLSCHGDVYGNQKNFYLLPHNATFYPDGRPNLTTVFGVDDFAKLLNGALVKNIVVWLDACHAGGAGEVLQRISFNLNPDYNIFIIGAVRNDQSAGQWSKLEHGLFTYNLLQACESKPHNGEWLYIWELYSEVSRRVKEFSADIQVQSFSTSVEPNLAVIQNPAYSPRNLEFYRQAQEILRLDGYKFGTALETTEALPALYLQATRERGANDDNYGLLICYDETYRLDAAVAQQLGEFIKAEMAQPGLRLRQFIIFTATELPAESREACELAVGDWRYVEFNSYQGTLNNLVRFEAHQQLLEDRYTKKSDYSSQPPLADVYIPLKAEERSQKIPAASEEALTEFDFFSSTDEQAFFTAQQRKIEETITPIPSLEQYMWEWLHEKGKPRLALLADYGRGKSTFCLHFAVMLFRERQRRQRESPQTVAEIPIPLLIPLNEYGRQGRSLADLIEYFFKKYCEEARPYSNLRKMAEGGNKFLFLLDGFDEMAALANEDIVSANLKLLDKLAGEIAGSRILLTTRPEYFERSEEEREVLQNYARLYLKPLDKTQIADYLQRRVGEPWQEYLQEIYNIYDLRDLAERAVFLEMIASTLDDYIQEYREKKRASVSRPRIYRDYMTKELRRQFEDKERYDLRNFTIARRLEIIEELAFQISLQPPNSAGETGLTAKQIQQICATTPGLLTPPQLDELEEHTRSILSCSFLDRPRDEFKFSHASFREYFLAYRLMKELGENKISNFEQRELTWATIEFIGEMLAFEELGDEPLKRVEKVQLYFGRLTDLLDQPEPADEHQRMLYPTLQRNLRGILLAHRIFQMQKIDDNRAICKGYLSQAEYQLFVDEMQHTKSYYYQPDHWIIEHYKGSALDPSLGARPRDMEVFCNWLNERYKGSSFQFRLPLAEEVTAFAAQAKEGEVKAASWLFEPGIFQVFTAESGLRGTLIHAKERAATRDLALARALALTDDLALAHDLALIHDLALTRDHDLAHTRHFSLALSLALARYLARTHEQLFVQIVLDLEKNNIRLALKKLKNLKVTANASNSKWTNLLQTLLEASDTKLAIDYRNKLRSFVRFYAEYSLAGYNLLEKDDKKPEKYSKEKSAMQGLLAWAAEIEARVTGRSQPFEGIRFVRERVERNSSE